MSERDKAILSLWEYHKDEDTDNIFQYMLDDFETLYSEMGEIGTGDIIDVLKRMEIIDD